MLTEEKKFLENYSMEDYERPSVTTDIVLFRYTDELEVLLIKRKSYPFKDMWAFPGGFCQPNETTEQTAKRELEEETGVKQGYLEQLFFMSEPNIDPRGWIMSSVYMGCVAMDTKAEAGDDAKEAHWFSVNSLGKALKEKKMELAFDHNEIFAKAVARLRNKVKYTNIAFGLLPDEFTMPRVQEVYEGILNRKYSRSYFRVMIGKRLTPVNKLEETKEKGRPSELYQLNPDIVVDKDLNKESLEDLF